MEFISRLYCKVIFSEDSLLNLTPKDLGQDMITGSIDEPPVARLPTATGTIGSLNIFVPVKLTINLLKTSPAFQNYWDRILNNGYIGGTATFYDDANNSYVISEVSISVSEMPSSNGQNAATNFTIEGNLEVNKKALAGF